MFQSYPWRREFPPWVCGTATYYRNKFKGLFAWYDQPGWAVPVRGLDARNLADRCTRLVEQGDALRPGLVAKSQEMAQRCSGTVVHALSLLPLRRA